jgi:hypothetical protein
LAVRVVVRKNVREVQTGRDRIMSTGLALFTIFHVFLSIAALVTGLVMLAGLLKARPYGGWTIAFLVSMAATMLTGFLFPFHGFTPALGVGIICILILGLAVIARYTFQMRGFWRPVYIVSGLTALYLNCFVFVVQAFQKIGPLHVLAPKGSEPPFAVVQAIVLLSFLFAGYLAVRGFRPRAA